MWGGEAKNTTQSAWMGRSPEGRGEVVLLPTFCVTPNLPAKGLGSQDFSSHLSLVQGHCLGL